MDCPYCRPDRQIVIREAGQFFVLRGDRHQEGALHHLVIVPKQHMMQPMFICRNPGMWQQIPEVIEDLRNRGNEHIRVVVNFGARGGQETDHGCIEIMIPQPRHGLDGFKEVTELEPAPPEPKPEPAIAPEGETSANDAISKLARGDAAPEGKPVIVGPAAELVEGAGGGAAGVEGSGASPAESE